MEHQKTTPIKCIEKIDEKIVDIVTGKKLGSFAVHIGNYNKDESDTGNNNSTILQTPNKDTNTTPHMVNNVQHS